MAEQEKTNPTQTEDWVMVPKEPTEAMHDAARDWSAKKFGKPIGMDASLGCYRAMLSAAPTISPRGSETAELQNIAALLAVEGKTAEALWLRDYAASLSPRGRGAEEAVADLREYAEHRPGCDYWAVSAKRRERSCDCGLDDALAALSFAPVSGGGGLEALAKHTNWELSYRYPDEETEGEWQVHRVNGGVNDREWTLIGSGPIPSTALANALAALPPPPATGEVGT